MTLTSFFHLNERADISEKDKLFLCICPFAPYVCVCACDLINLLSTKWVILHVPLLQKRCTFVAYIFDEFCHFTHTVHPLSIWQKTVAINQRDSAAIIWWWDRNLFFVWKWNHFVLKETIVHCAEQWNRNEETSAMHWIELKWISENQLLVKCDGSNCQNLCGLCLTMRDEWQMSSTN